MVWHFFLALLLIAFLYSAVGHGGASGYLALFALYSLDPTMMKGSALILNIFVSAIAFWQYYQKGYFKFKLFWPLAITSIPAAFLGGIIQLDTRIYKIILGLFLIFSLTKILDLLPTIKNSQKQPISIYLALLIGAILGFLSGLIGIGGGILLSPILLIFKWATIKETAAVSALFIFVNSLAGFLGLKQTEVELYSSIYLLIISTICGGIFGSYLGANRFNSQILKYLLALVLTFAAVKLLFF